MKIKKHVTRYVVNCKLTSDIPVSCVLCLGLLIWFLRATLPRFRERITQSGASERQSEWHATVWRIVIPAQSESSTGPCVLRVTFRALLHFPSLSLKQLLSSLFFLLNFIWINPLCRWLFKLKWTIQNEVKEPLFLLCEISSEMSVIFLQWKSAVTFLAIASGFIDLGISVIDALNPGNYVENQTILPVTWLASINNGRDWIDQIWIENIEIAVAFGQQSDQGNAFGHIVNYRNIQQSVNWSDKANVWECWLCAVREPKDGMDEYGDEK